MSKRTINRFECFASPLSGDGAAVIEEINSSYVGIYTRLFMDRHEGTLADETDGIIALIGLWLNLRPDFDVAWSPVFGLVRQATLFSLDPLSVAVLLSLHLNSMGIRSDWIARFPKPIRMRWSNIILPKAVSIHVENQKNKSDVTLDDGRSERKIVLSAAQSARYLKTKGCRWFPSVRIGAKRLCIFLPDEPNNFGFETRSESPMLQTATKSVEQAFDLLETHAKPYFKWVTQVIREVVALRCSRGILRSNSSEDWPGKIQLSLPRRPVEVAEMLVHEASHQYFNIAQRFEAVSDGDDRKLYYSPVKGTDRPIDKILLAFHAFANVGLFYKSCIATGLDDKNYCKKNLERHLPELNELAEHLRSCNSLTNVGRALWEPLANSVF
jgi:hypothetical protein